MFVFLFFWEKIVFFALLILVGIIIFDFLLVEVIKLTKEQKKILEFIDFWVISILFVDIVYKYAKTKDKIYFLKENIFIILSFLPYLSFFAIFRFLTLLNEIGVWFKVLKLTLIKKELKI